MDLPATLEIIWKELHPHIKRALDLWERQLKQEPLVVENQIVLDENKCSAEIYCVECSEFNRCKKEHI